jgi:N-acetylglucosaminyldiphosphoundecaprenol N-acetyl-beta-D-mannosaminyltransferase
MPNRLAGPIFATEITPVTKDALLTDSQKLMQEIKRPIVILGHNLHSAYLYRQNRLLRALYDSADIILADGKPIALDANLRLRQLKLRQRTERIGSTDWILDLIKITLPARISVIGTNKEANAQFVAKLESLFPSSTVIGIPGEGWNDAKATAAVEVLKGFNPKIVFVGLGMPLQEEFLYQAREDLPPSLYIAVGGALDQLTGNQALAPRWLGNIGLEWLWRLAHDPRRLSERYLLEPVKLLSLRLHEIWQAYIND